MMVYTCICYGLCTTLTYKSQELMIKDIMTLFFYFSLPTDVQSEAIPLILGGGDVLMAAETGSGKTGAFCLPIAQIVWETLKDEREPKKGPKLSPAVRRWVLSSKDRSEGLAVTPDGLRCQSREQRVWHGCRATTGVADKGKYFFEASVMDEGLCRVGWSTESVSFLYFEFSLPFFHCYSRQAMIWGQMLLDLALVALARSPTVVNLPTMEPLLEKMISLVVGWIWIILLLGS